LSRDFPSLSGAPQQAQSQSPAQAVWATANQRATQQTPVQRQQPPSTQVPSRTSQTQTHHSQQLQPPHDDLFPSGTQFASRLDDFRNGGHGISGQLGSAGQPQTGNIDEFPPLGRNVHGDLSQERRGSVLQTSGLGSYGSSMAFSGQNQSSQTRNLIGATLSGQENSRIMSPAAPGSGGKFADCICQPEHMS
jgi:CCR4-NOT transcription complex subunit 2